MFEIKGKIVFDPINKTKKHHNQASWKKVAMVEFRDDIWSYYSWFLEKRFNLKLNKPLRGTHFTIINDIVDDEVYLQAKELFDGKEVTIQYDPNLVRSNKKGHWWLKAYSDDAQNIRNVMGLGDPYFGFHITIGLATHDELEKSEIVRVNKTNGYIDGNKLFIERLINKGVLKYKDGRFI
jgi:hypothetical protein